jgi:hypothetical protein
MEFLVGCDVGKGAMRLKRVQILAESCMLHRNKKEALGQMPA